MKVCYDKAMANFETVHNNSGDSRNINAEWAMLKELAPGGRLSIHEEMELEGEEREKLLMWSKNECLSKNPQSGDFLISIGLVNPYQDFAAKMLFLGFFTSHDPFGSRD